jgi:hypothetical protein
VANSRIIKLNNCRECPYSLETFCENVVIKTKLRYGMDHFRRFKRLERGRNYTGFPEWCPLEIGDVEMTKSVGLTDMFNEEGELI